MAKTGLYMIFDKKHQICISIQENDEANKENDIILYTKLNRAKKMLKMAKEHAKIQPKMNPDDIVLVEADLGAVGEIK